jgi:hypothetical protein
MIRRVIRRRQAKLVALALAAALPAACAAPRVPPPPANPFAGAWSNPERQEIAFRGDTVVLTPPGMPPTAMSAASCDGAFRFGYGQMSRGQLIGLAPKQPDVAGRLAGLLARPDYPVAQLACGEGDSTYVLLDPHDVLAIHRDRDIVGLERLSRP